MALPTALVKRLDRLRDKLDDWRGAILTAAVLLVIPLAGAGSMCAAWLALVSDVAYM